MLMPVGLNHFAKVFHLRVEMHLHCFTSKVVKNSRSVLPSQLSPLKHKMKMIRYAAHLQVIKSH